MGFIGKSSVLSYYRHMIAKRQLLKSRHLLKQSNLFIFPSLFGSAYCLLILLLWVLGSNYENNLVLGLCYLLISIFLISIFHTYFNMQGLVISAESSDAVFCSEQAMISLTFERLPKRQHSAIELCWLCSDDFELTNGVQTISIGPSDKLSKAILLPLRTRRRGLLLVPKLALKSYYPFGLLRCWCQLSIDCTVLVYPKPVSAKPRSLITSDSDKGKEQSLVAEGEFEGLQLYREAEPISHIAWKHYARSDILYKKQFSGLTSDQARLHWQQYPNIDSELRLQYLCAAALTLANHDRVFSLEIPHKTVTSASGKRHLALVLTALARFGESRVEHE